MSSIFFGCVISFLVGTAIASTVAHSEKESVALDVVGGLGAALMGIGFLGVIGSLIYAVVVRIFQ